MSEADRIKEEIGWLKVVFGLLFASDLSLLAWLAQNFADASRGQTMSAMAAVVAVTITIAWVNHRAFSRMEQLEKL